MTAKSDRIWRSTRVWCYQNPEKDAAIITPEGTFVITFHPKKVEALKGKDSMNKTSPEAKTIYAQMMPDWVSPYADAGGQIPVVLLSDHPRFVAGTRLDWGFVSVALKNGYRVEIAPNAD